VEGGWEGGRGGNAYIRLGPQEVITCFLHLYVSHRSSGVMTLVSQNQWLLTNLIADKPKGLKAVSRVVTF